MTKRVFSGIQPSGSLHIGNYFGAIKNWPELQSDNDCLYCVVDLHAITVYQKPEILRQKIFDTAAIILAAGIDPKKSIVFIQSRLKEHAELAWILNTITPIAELQRMTQFKDKAGKQKTINAGLLNYLVLMAADILLYQTEKVPVGEDQKQHVELARVIARKFNNLYGETFKEPQSLVKKEGARIMSLSDPTKKMSKSDKDPRGCINLTDSAETIREKIKKAVTDSGREIKFDERKPAISNLLTIYSLASGKTIRDLEKKYAGGSYGEFKKEMAEAVIESLRPFQEKYRELKNNLDYVTQVLQDGAQKARAIAEPMMERIKKKIGIL